jgi:NADH-dependent peroxiredoxin subunit F
MTVYDLIIIGAGPAGITAAIYSARKKINFLIIAQETGGQVIENLVIENYTGYQEISGIELISKFEEHLKEFQFDHVTAYVDSIKIGGTFTVSTNQKTYQAKSLLICTGAVPRYLGVKGELEFKNRGLSYCATCDGPLFAGKDIAIIGGGNTALTTALQMDKIASKIYIIEQAEKLNADAVLIEKIMQSKKLKIYHAAKVTSIYGDKFVQGLEIFMNGRKINIEAEGIFINIGYAPATGFVKEEVLLNENNEIIVDHLNHTSVPGVFAAGDCTDIPYKQIIIAAGHGATAALSINNYLLKSVG